MPRPRRCGGRCIRRCRRCRRGSTASSNTAASASRSSTRATRRAKGSSAGARSRCRSGCSPAASVAPGSASLKCGPTSTRATRPWGSRCGQRRPAGTASRTSAMAAAASTSARRTTRLTPSSACFSSGGCTGSYPGTTTASYAKASSVALPLCGSGPASEQLAGAGVCDVRAAVADGRAVDPDVLDAGAADEEPVGAGGEVPDPLLRRHADGVGVEGNEVGGQAFLDQAAVRDAEDLRGLTGQTPHRLLEGKDSLLPRPVPEQVGRETGVAQLAGVGAGVREAEHRSLVLQELADLFLVVVGEDDAEARLQILLEGEVDGCVHR